MMKIVTLIVGCLMVFTMVSNAALVAQWTFNETSGDALDVSGYGSAATATNNGGVGRADEGLQRYATLDGIDDYFDAAASNAKLNLSTGATVVAWIRYASGEQPADYAVLAGKGTTQYSLNLGSARHQAYANDASTLWYAENNVFDAGWWNFQAMTYDGTNLIQYRGLPDYPLGPLASAPTVCAGLPLKDSSTHPFVMGSIVGSAGNIIVNPDYMFKGDINEVQVYNEALDMAALTGLYNGGPAEIPEPMTMLLLGLGGFLIRRKK